MPPEKKPNAEELVTIKVKRRVKWDIDELQALLQLKEHRKFSQSDIVEFAIGRLPELKIPLPSKMRVVTQKEG